MCLIYNFMVVVCRRKEWVGIHIDGTGERFPFKSLACFFSLQKNSPFVKSRGGKVRAKKVSTWAWFIREKVRKGDK